MPAERKSAADFDPVSATVYGPQQLKHEDSGEAYSGPPVAIWSGCRLKTVGLYTTDKTNQEHGQSQGTQYIDIRSEGRGSKLTSENFIVHRGTRYDIIGRLNSDYRNGTTRYQVNATNDYIHNG